MSKKLWDLVNFAETLRECEYAKKQIDRAVDEHLITNQQFDELMMALSYLFREAYSYK